VNHQESDTLRRIAPGLRAEVQGIAARLAAKTILDTLPVDPDAEDHRLDLADALHGPVAYCLYCPGEAYALGLCHVCYRRFRRLMRRRVRDAV
jgi:hypothetical protein